MSIVVNSTLPVVAAQTTSGVVALQPGTVIAARVLQVLDSGQVQIAIGDQQLAVRSEVSLQAGQTLQLAVSQTADGFRLAVVPQQTTTVDPTELAAASSATLRQAVAQVTAESAVSLASQLALPTVAQTSALTPQETVAVSTAAQAAAARQDSLATLFANLSAVDLTTLPPKLQVAVAQVLLQQTTLDPSLNASDIKQAFQSSGLFLEASLASGVAPSATTPDLKAALIVLRQTLATTLSTTSATPAATTTTTSTTTTNAQATTLPSVATLTPQAATLTATLTPEQLATTLATLANAASAATTATTLATVTSPTLAPTTTTETTAQTNTTAATTTAQQPVIAIVDETAEQILALQTAASSATQATIDADRASSVALAALEQAVQDNPLLAGQTARLLPGGAAMLSLVPLLSGAKPPVRAEDDAALQSTTPPPPIRGALPSVQPVAAATVVSHAPLEETTRRLLADTDAALARQTLLQVASLPDRVDAQTTRFDTTTARWAFEIPFVTPQGTAIAQFEISREGAARTGEATQRIWRAKFSLDVEPAGPVHAWISLTGDRTSVKMWAERPATAAQLRAGASQLSQALSRADLKPGEIVVRDGAPNEAARPSAGYFLDRAL